MAAARNYNNLVILGLYGGDRVARPRQHAFRVKLTVTAGNNKEAVARALETWAILLADHAQRVVVNELRQRDADQRNSEREVLPK